MYIYTDWWCISPNSKGSYAYVITSNEAMIDCWYWFSSSTTNNRMELMAIYRWLLHVMESGYTGPIKVISDSQYAIGVASWRMKAKLNTDLVRSIRSILSNNDISRERVKWHSWNMRNEFVDDLCTKLINENYWQNNWMVQEE